MKLLQLQYFQAVCKIGSTLHAASALSVSQPTISSAIKELEHEFGVPLFLRNGKHLELTQEGRVLLQLSDDLIRRADNVAQTMHDLAGKRNRIHLGIPPMLASLLLPKLYATFSKQYADVDFEIEEGSKFRLFERLNNSEVDMVITGHGVSDGKEFHSLPITELEYVFYVAKEHPLAERPCVTIEDIKDERMAVFRNSYQEENTAAYFAQYGLNPQIKYESEQLSTIFGLVSNNLMTAMLYQGLSSRYPDMRGIPLDPPMKKNVSLFWRKDGYFFRDMDCLIRCIRQLKTKL